MQKHSSVYWFQLQNRDFQNTYMWPKTPQFSLESFFYRKSIFLGFGAKIWRGLWNISFET